MGLRLAYGNMAEVWGKWVCPVCGGELEPIEDEYDGGYHHDNLDCAYCGIKVTYISKQEYHEYHEVPDSERYYEIS